MVLNFSHSTGIIAVSCGEGLSFDDRVDNFSRILMTSSLVLIWSFSDPIHPLVCVDLMHHVIRGCAIIYMYTVHTCTVGVGICILQGCQKTVVLVQLR